MKKNLFRGVKEKAVFYIIIPVVVIISLICFVLFYSIFKSEDELARVDFEYLLRKHANYFEKIISNSIDYLSVITSGVEFRVEAGITDREALQKMLFNIFDRHPSIHSSSVYFEPNSYDGNDAMYVGTEFGTAHSGRICFYYNRTNGKTHFKPEALANDVEFSLPFYVMAKESNSPIYTDPAIVSIDGIDTFMFVITFPIRNRNKEFIGAITADILLDNVYNELKNETIYKTGYMLVENERNRVIYSPRAEDIGKIRAEVGITYPIPLDAEKTVFLQTRSIINAKESLTAINKIYIPQLDSSFFLSIAAPVAEINAEGMRLFFIVLAFSILVLTLIATFLYIVIGKLTMPFIEFTEKADKIAVGDYSIRIKGDYRDEFAVLKDSMNQMAGSIEKYIQESKTSQKILQNILDGIDAYIYVTVPHSGELLFINEQMRKMFNLKDGEGIGQKCYKVFRNNMDEKCPFCPCFELDTDPNKIIVWEEHVPEIGRDIRHTDRYINWPGGAKVHLQNAIDVTDIKTITEEKIKAERSAEELERKKEQAEETTRMKSVFLASMSHEIRTPMHGIIGFSELALDDKISQQTRTYLTRIKTSAESLLLIINDILDVSKIEAGKMELEKIPFNINDVFKLCRVISSPKAQEKGLTLFCYAEPSIGKMLIGDPTRLRQILLNLLSNAIKFTNNGMVKLLSAIVDKTEHTITVHFEVKDSGIGMNAEQISRIFQPFIQADDSTTRKYGGTGLGLTISKNFVEMMGGKLYVESQIGLGSKFSFDLAFETIDVDESYIRPDVVVNDDERPVFKGEILICEDNALNQMVIGDHLSRIGLKTVIAANGRIGVKIVKDRMKNAQNGDKPFDLIFMDIHMPEMDGLEATKKIIEMGVKTPIVALTANIMTKDREMYFASGMCDCLSKPFLAHELWACLRNHLVPVSVFSVNKEAEYSEEDNQRMELIIAFINSNQTTFNDITDAINAGDITLAHRLAHTLKGVAGLVGMTALEHTAQVIEEALSKGNDRLLNEHLKILGFELDAALSELKVLADNFSSQVNLGASDASHISDNISDANIFDNKKSLKILEDLEIKLKDDNFDSLNFVKDLKMIPGTEQLGKLVESLQFKQAREALVAVKQQITLEKLRENKNGQ